MDDQLDAKAEDLQGTSIYVLKNSLEDLKKFLSISITHST